MVSIGNGTTSPSPFQVSVKVGRQPTQDQEVSQNFQTALDQSLTGTDREISDDDMQALTAAATTDGDRAILQTLVSAKTGGGGIRPYESVQFKMDYNESGDNEDDEFAAVTLSFTPPETPVEPPKPEEQAATEATGRPTHAAAEILAASPQAAQPPTTDDYAEPDPGGRSDDNAEAAPAATRTRTYTDAGVETDTEQGTTASAVAAMARGNRVAVVEASVQIRPDGTLNRNAGVSVAAGDPTLGAMVRARRGS